MPSRRSRRLACRRSSARARAAPRGTAPYVAPEQARSEPLHPGSDLSAFGLVLYQMATRKKPLTGNNGVTTLDANLNQKPASPPKLNPALPSDLEGIIGRA